jgi:hypothetical protein
VKKTKYISKSAKLVTGQTNKQTNFYLTFWDKLSLLRSSYNGTECELTRSNIDYSEWRMIKLTTAIADEVE